MIIPQKYLVVVTKYRHPVLKGAIKVYLLDKIIKLLLLDLFVKTLVSNSNRIIGSHIFGAIVTLCVAFRTEQNRL